MTHNLYKRIIQASAQVKLSVGVCNNAAWFVCLEAHDHIKKHRNYRNNVKKSYKRAIEEFQAYERNLIYARTNRMFHVDDMPPEARKKYGDITDRDLYDFWANIGATAYQDSRPLVTSLVNKYRLSLVEHKVLQAEVLAWPMAGMACLELARQVYQATMNAVTDTFNIPQSLATQIFKQFDIERVANCWNQALVMTDPDMTNYKLNKAEDRNISLGIEQLQEAWSDVAYHLRMTADTVAIYDDLFRTKGEMKKTLREIKEIEQDIQQSS